jgi:hypothetical protein
MKARLFLILAFLAVMAVQGYAKKDTAKKIIGVEPKIDIITPLEGLLNSYSAFNISLDKSIGRRMSMEFSYRSFYENISFSNQGFPEHDFYKASQGCSMLACKYYIRKNYKAVYFTYDTINDGDSVVRRKNFEPVHLGALEGPYVGLYAKSVSDYVSDSSANNISTYSSHLEYYNKGIGFGAMIGFQTFIKHRIGLDVNFEYGAIRYYYLDMVRSNNVSYSLKLWQPDWDLRINLGYMF